MGLDHVVLTMVARDDLDDGGMAHVAACVEAIRFRRPSTTVETLISDVKGDADSLDVLFAVRPDVLNHNIESVARLQRAVRPSAGYARSLSVLARAKAAGLVTKSSLIVGMGETDAEVIGCLADLAGIGVDIVTIGQYLRPTSHHLPVARWVEPTEFDAVEGDRRAARHRPRRGQPAHPLELPRQGRRRRTRPPPSASADKSPDPFVSPRSAIFAGIGDTNSGRCMDLAGSGVNSAMVTEGAVAARHQERDVNDRRRRGARGGGHRRRRR